MSAPDPLADAINALTDECVRRRFGVEPVEDPSGLLLSAPAPTPDEDEQFDAYMRRYSRAAFGVAQRRILRPDPGSRGPV